MKNRVIDIRWMIHSEVRMPIIFPRFTTLRIESIPVELGSGIPETEGFGNIPPLPCVRKIGQQINILVKSR